MKPFVYIFCIVIGLISTIDGASTTGKQTTRNTPPRTTPRPTQRTSPAPSYSYCYTCQYGYCPMPFRSSSVFVSRDISSSTWCVKISDSDALNAKGSRGVGGSYCSSRGCSWRNLNGVNRHVCCCYGNLCNSALTTSKSNISTLFFSFLMIMTVTKTYF